MTTRSSSRHVDESCDLIGISSTCPNADARSFVTAAALPATATVTCPAQFPKAGTWVQFRVSVRRTIRGLSGGRGSVRPVGITGTFGRKKVSVRWTIVGLLEFREEDGLCPVDNSGTLGSSGRLRVCPVDNVWSKERRKAPRELRSWVIVVVSASSPKSFLSPQELPTYHSLKHTSYAFSALSFQKKNTVVFLLLLLLCKIAKAKAPKDKRPTSRSSTFPCLPASFITSALLVSFPSSQVSLACIPSFLPSLLACLVLLLFVLVVFFFLSLLPFLSPAQPHLLPISLSRRLHVLFSPRILDYYRYPCRRRRSLHKRL